MHTAPHVYAYAFDVRHVETDALLGVGLIVPPERHVSFLAESTRTTVSPQRQSSLWDAIGIRYQETREQASHQPAPVAPDRVAILETDVSGPSRDGPADGRLLQGFDARAALRHESVGQLGRPRDAGANNIARGVRCVACVVRGTTSTCGREVHP